MGCWITSHCPEGHNQNTETLLTSLSNCDVGRKCILEHFIITNVYEWEALKMIYTRELYSELDL